MTELLIYGVDGFSNRVVSMLTESSDLMPTVEELQDREGSSHGVFESYIGDANDMGVPRTGPMWYSIYSGRKPKDHGYTMDGWHEGDSRFHQFYSVWDKLGEEGVNMALWDMPMTYRAKEINGYMLSGFVTTSLKALFNKTVYPDDLIEDKDFIENLPAYVAKVKFNGAAPEMAGDPEKGPEDFYEAMREAEMNQLEKFKEIYEERGRPDVVAYGTTFADKIGHADSIMPNRELTRKTYSDVDDVLAELIELTDPDNVVIISDHGFSGYEHDLEGYYLNTEGTELPTVFDFTPFLLNYFGIDYEESEYGLKENPSGLSQAEKEDIKESMVKMGYGADDEDE